MSSSSRASYKGLQPASKQATAAAQGSSRKSKTRCELVLRRALRLRGMRYRVDVAALPGRPDIVFSRARVLVFCDGDFWHGRDLAEREAKLARGHNPGYWLAKIRGNVERDRQHEQALRDAGWIVLRYWETDILRAPDVIAREIEQVVRHWLPSTQAARAHPRG